MAPVPTNLLSLLSIASVALGAPAYKCTTFIVPINVTNVTTIVPPFAYPLPDGYAATAFANEATIRDSPSITSSLTTFTGTFNIAAEYCTPKKKGRKSHTIQILTHGLGFSKFYWDFRLPIHEQDAQYSYINSALTAGYSTLAWDRLGCGDSPPPGPYTVIQAPIELAVLATLASLTRSGAIPQVPNLQKTFHVGHSYGSILSNALAASFPNLSDDIVLTGWSHLFKYSGYFLASTNLHLASENQPERFANYSSGYLTWGDTYANQYAFLEYPYFDPAVLEYAESIKYPFTAGELLTQSALNCGAAGFKGPVLYMASQADLIFCQSDCVGLFGADSAALKAFGGSDEVVVQPHVGHGLNLHEDATAAYDVIQGWTRRHGF